MEETMFGHKDSSTATAKKLSVKDAMAQHIDAMESGKELVFRLGEIYVKPFITIAHNPDYPAKGKKYIAFQEGAGPDNKPGGKRGKFWETNNTKEIASWILDREGHPYQG
jgi:hypothetical protein